MIETSPLANPAVIQGGMGFNISTWHLARSVALRGGLGTVSGVALERVLPIILQSGDVGGHFRRALAHFPYPHIAEEVLKTYFIEPDDQRKQLAGIPVFQVEPSPMFIKLSICANFAAIWLAKEGHSRPVSINYLEKIPPHIYAIWGAMLAGVDYITVGAGIPFQIPEIINAILEGRPVKYRIPVEGGKVGYTITFEPEAFLGGKPPPMKKPRFLPIISSNALAGILLKKLPAGSIHGFVIEEPTAGGHNAPPRGLLVLNGEGEPIYGARDSVKYSELADLGLPFWIGGSKASPEMLAWACSAEVRAAGIQVGTAFALCEESGMDPVWRKLVRELGFTRQLRVKTDNVASPAGFPFKVAPVPGTIFESARYLERERACQHRVLVSLYEKLDGSIGYRCPAEPVLAYVTKGGKLEDTVGRRCLCSHLLAAAGLGMPADADSEKEVPIITLGDDVERLMPLLMHHATDIYHVDDVFNYLGC